MGQILFPVLRGKMAENGLSYKDMAIKLGIHETAFANKINGRNQWKANEIIEILDTFDCKFDEMFRR